MQRTFYAKLRGAVFFQLLGLYTAAWSCPEQYSVFSTDTSDLRDRSAILFGNLGSNSYVELGVEAKLYGNLISGGTAVLRDRAVIDGNAETANLLTRFNQTSITGSIRENASVDPCVLSQKSISFGSADLTIGPDQTYTLEPGRYRDVQVYSRCTLYLKQGNYSFRNFRLDTDVRVILLENTGTEIDVQDTLVLSDRDNFSFYGPSSALALNIYTNQTTSLRLGTDATFMGVLSAPLADIHVASRTFIIGNLYARNISIEPDVQICTPPKMLDLRHSEGAFGPFFQPTRFEYQAIVPSSTTQMSFAYEPERNADTIRINGKSDSTVLFPNDTLQVEFSITRPAVDSFPKACFESHYHLTAIKNQNYSVRVEGTSPCTGAGCDGTTWDKAYKDLQSGLDAAEQEGKEIWLAQGTYKPTVRRTEGDARSATFLLGSGAEMHGGFEGLSGEDLQSRRGSIDAVILSGDIAGNDPAPFPPDSQSMADNAYHVVTLTGNIADGILMDRVSIKNGAATGTAAEDQQGAGMVSEGASPNLREMIFTKNYARQAGAALFATNGTSLKLFNSYVVGNMALAEGGAIMLDHTEGNFGNLVFADNSAAKGGAISIHSSSPVIRFSTIARNQASTGGGIFVTGIGAPLIDHSILWLNSASDGPGFYREAPAVPTLRYTDVQNAFVGQTWNASLGINGGGNLMVDPLFYDPSLGAFGQDATAFSQDDGLQLGDSSPVIDKGEGTPPGNLTYDLFGTVRPTDGDKDGTEKCDMGAYERFIIEAGEMSFGYFSITTGKFFPNGNPMAVSSYQTEEFKTLRYSNASNTIKISVAFNKHLKDKVYGNVVGLDENGHAVASSVKVWFYKIDSESNSKTWVYATQRFISPGNVDGKPIFFTTDPTLKNEAYEFGYIIPAKPGVSLNISFPHSQF